MALKGRAWVGVCAVAVAAGLLGIQPAGAQAQVAPTCDASSYSLALQSLTGPPRADLVIRITAKVPGCVLPESLSAPGQALAVQRSAREDTRLRRRSGARRSGHREHRTGSAAPACPGHGLVRCGDQPRRPGEDAPQARPRAHARLHRPIRPAGTAFLRRRDRPGAHQGRRARRNRHRLGRRFRAGHART